ncbi:MAG: PAS domain-containing protein, partial [Ilumatobacteraceae bacterium]
MVVAGTWRVVVVVLVIRLDTDRSARALAAAIGAALLAATAVVITWLESRRITAHLNRTIDRLIDAESELRVLLDDLPEAVMSVDDDGLIRGVNAKVAELTGRPVGELVGRRLDGLLDTPRRDELWAWLADGRRGHPVGPISVRLLHFDRSASTLVEATVERTRHTGGAVLVRLRDITEREARGQALEQARRRF